MNAAKKIIIEVCVEHDITYAQLMGGSRYKPIVHARFECCWRISRELGYATTRIGRILGRDHTSVMSALKRWPEIRHLKPTVQRQTILRRIKDNPEQEPHEIFCTTPDKPLNLHKRMLWDKHGKTLTNRTQAIDTQIKNAKRYGHEKKAAELEVRRELIVSGVTAYHKKIQILEGQGQF